MPVHPDPNWNHPTCDATEVIVAPADGHRQLKHFALC